MAIKHAFESEKEDGGDETLVRPSDWNADHIGRIGKSQMEWTTNKLLKGAGDGADPTEIDVPVIQVKVGAGTRNLAAESGDVSYTGYGFTPTGLIIFASYPTYGSIGCSNPDKGAYCIAYTATPSTEFQNLIINLIPSAGKSQTAVVKSYDADGFTLSWTKTSTPSGTANLTMFAFK